MLQIFENNLAKWGILSVLVILLLASLANLPPRIGTVDFRAYWSASYLLSQGENFSDDALLLQTELAFTRYDRDFPIKTWNPPWILVWLLPYAWAGFQTGTHLWLLTNIGAFFFSVVVSWQMLYPHKKNRNKWLWSSFLFAVLFPSTIVALLFGQMSFMVLAGLTGFLFFYQREQDVPAGLILTLTTFKPHLVYLVVPIIFLQTIRDRRWKVLLSFAGLLFVSTGILFFLRPTFLSDYVVNNSTGNLLGYETATAVTYLSLITNQHWIRLLSVGFLPLTSIIWFFKGKNWSLVQFSLWGTFLSVITMPFGWSYDFVVLLFPINQWLIWMITKKWPLAERIGLLGLMLIIYIIYYLQRISTPSELFFYWVPLAMVTLYGYTAWRSHNRP